MKARSLPLAAILPLLLLTGCLGAPPSSSGAEAARTEARRERPSAKRKPRERGVSGKFDFYVLALSWSPGFCATPAGRNDDTQCGPQRHFAFVLHGLWPQYENRGWPQDCSTEPLDRSVVDAMLPIMPSTKLIGHEWRKHGTCSGLSSKEYFEEATEAFRAVKIPAAYQAPMKTITVDPDQVQRDLASANPGFPAGSFVVTCTGNGRFLQEVRACLTKDLEGRPCNREVQRSACRSNEVIMRPVR
jgi:ribonuclease T2